MEYNKPAKSVEELVDKLINKNLQNISREELSNVFYNVSYYRLKGYIYHYHDNTKKIDDNILWQNIWNDYNFDMDIKTLLYYEIGKIEVKLRSLLINIFSVEYGEYWYNNSNLFHNEKMYKKDIKNLLYQWKFSQEPFKKHFVNTYKNEYPPSWMIFETASFGILSKIYENIIYNESKNIISSQFGFTKNSQMVLSSWLHHLVNIRNIVAHYSRLFPKQFSSKPQIYKSKQDFLGHDLDTGKLFTTIIIIAYLLHSTNNNVKLFITNFNNLLKNIQFLIMIL